MAELVRTLGDNYASNFPYALALPVAFLGFLLFLAVRARDIDDAGSKRAAYVALVIVAAIVLIQFPAAVNAAKSECERQFENAGGGYGWGANTNPIQYAGSKCAKVWPSGPKAGNTGLSIP